jgi:hypothetical protein
MTNSPGSRESPVITSSASPSTKWLSTSPPVANGSTAIEEPPGAVARSSGRFSR